MAGVDNGATAVTLHPPWQRYVTAQHQEGGWAAAGGLWLVAAVQVFAAGFAGFLLRATTARMMHVLRRTSGGHEPEGERQVMGLRPHAGPPIELQGLPGPVNPHWHCTIACQSTVASQEHSGSNQRQTCLTPL